MTMKSVIGHLTTGTIIVFTLICIGGQAFAVNPVADITIGVNGKTTAVETVPVSITADETGTAVFHSESLQYLSQSGHPQIPWKVITVLLPPNADMKTVSCSIVSAQYETIEGVWNVLPTPPMATRDVDGNEIVIWPPDRTIIDGCDVDIYSADAFWPAQTVQLTGSGKLRRWQLAEVTVPLVRYNPASGELQWLVQAEISVDCDKKGKAVGHTKEKPHKKYKRDRIKKLAVNFDKAVELYAASQGETETLLLDAPAGDAGVIPATVSGTNGYVIITTNDIRASSTKLADFVTHKQNLGFTVTVIDEDDTGATAVGDPAATKLREWLQANYISMDIKYVLIIGDPRIDQGYVPMKYFPYHYYSEIIDIPTDYFYAELTCDWDKDNDGIIGETGDDATNGDEIERYFEVYVGRVPYYGEIVDTDAILQKTIDYETSTDTQWRRHTLISTVPSDSTTPGYNWGEQIKADLLEPKAIPSDRVYRDGSGYVIADCGIVPPPEFPAPTYPADVWSQGQYGLHVWFTHGWAMSAIDVIESVDTAGLNDSYPTTTFQVACLNADPSRTNNLTYSILKNGGIAANGATANSYYVLGQSDFSNTGTNAGMGYRYAKGVTEGKACGETLWDLKEEIGDWRIHNWTVFNLYGDPSVVVMGEVPALTITPTDTFYTTAKHAVGSNESRAYTLKNNSDTSLNWTATKTANWLDISASGGTLATGGTATVTLTLNAAVTANLDMGIYEDIVTFTDTNHSITEERKVTLNIVFNDSLEGYWSLDEVDGNTARDASVHNNDGALLGGVTFDTSSVTGQFGGALQFDGINDYVLIDQYKGIGGMTARTISAWIKTTTTGAIVHWGGSGQGEKFTFRVQSDNGTAGAIRLEVNGGYIVGTTDVRNGQWHHVAMVLPNDGSPNVNEALLYVDGVYDGSSASLLKSINTVLSDDVKIGSDSGDRYFNGAIDDVRIYSYAMNSAEIQDLVNGGIAEAPRPYNRAIGIQYGILNWAPSAAATSNQVYIGTDPTIVADADTGSTEYQGSTLDASWDFSAIQPNTTYYWRIDSVTASGTITGPLWMFTTAGQIFEAGFVAHWKLDDGTGDTAADSGPGSHDATLDGPQWTAGFENDALLFDGQDDRADVVGYKGIIGSGSRTVTAWIKTSAIYNPGAILCYGDRVAPGGQFTFLVGMYGQISLNVGGNGYVTGTTNLCDGQWHHVAVVLQDDGDPDVTEAVLYVDGVNDGVSASDSEPVNTRELDDATIGLAFSTDYFTGTIDDVRIYDIALSTQAMSDLYGSYMLGGDINTDRFVDLVDFSLFAQKWLDPDCSDATPCGRANIDGDNDVDVDDLLELAQDWLQ